LGGYFKKYQVELFSRRTWGYVLAASWAFIYASMVALLWLKQVAGIQYLSPIYFRNMNMVPALIFSVSLFFVFKNLGLKHNKVINTVAGTVFGVFLIHDNQFMESWLWRHFKFAYQFPPVQFFLFAVLVAVVVFCVCSLADYVRILVLERPGFALLERHASKRLDRWDAWMNGEESEEIAG
jgi:hypothetical protein